LLPAGVAPEEEEAEDVAAEELSEAEEVEEEPADSPEEDAEEEAGGRGPPEPFPPPSRRAPRIAWEPCPGPP
jgi:hypothetical protein